MNPPRQNDLVQFGAEFSISFPPCPFGLFGLFWPLTIAQSHTRAAAVFVDEFGIVPES
jgi:hypothetical protein